ncbi:putative glucose-6-phosphate 1-epimerase isoform X2 [Prosopis cineraria]|uniref:putative glucose-6-phosphate 1-epimerase isoform X2 n=1 Tax=Prosopis cineraria TaxID=364024 RepID=UPI00240F6C06|nr:putative glucose-6-phosphate 1-epimerase isoform X2 [Prosopis cineraria]
MGHSGAVWEWDYKSAIMTTKDRNGIDQIVLRNSQGASAKVSLHGAQVTSWRNEKGEELLFTSSKVIPKAPKTIRGGIRICFPQFGSCGSSELHGFVRNKMWKIDDNPPPLPAAYDHEGKSFVDLLLKSTEEDMKCWPHSEVRIEGLETLDYLDNLFQRERFTEQGDAITFESEVDRAYLSSPNVIAVLDHGRKRTFVIRKEGLPDVAVWNPWDKKSRSMADFGDGEYKQMLSVDGAVIEKPLTLKPSEEWTGRLQLSIVPSSFCSIPILASMSSHCYSDIFSVSYGRSTQKERERSV